MRRRDPLHRESSVGGSVVGGDARAGLGRRAQSTAGVSPGWQRVIEASLDHVGGRPRGVLGQAEGIEGVPANPVLEEFKTLEQCALGPDGGGI